MDEAKECLVEPTECLVLLPRGSTGLTFFTQFSRSRIVHGEVPLRRIMPQISFTLDSLLRSEYESLMLGYQGIAQCPLAPPSFVEHLHKILNRACSVIVLLRGRVNTIETDPSVIDLTRHPILDPEFLEFCITVARSLGDGALLGAGDGEDFFYPNGLTLSESIESKTTVFLGGSRLMVPITPHSYSAPVSDVPVYARLCALQRLTKDRSTEELLNRLALWLSHFVYTVHFGRNIVACYPGRATKQVLNKEFFTRISSSMFL